MTLPDRIVEIGFTGPSTGTYLHLDDPVRGRLDTATLAPTDLWTDVSAYVVSVSTRRGASRTDGPVLRYEGGTATIVLRNEDRRFDPTNLDGPYVSAGVTQVEPMRAVRVRARWDGVTYPVWRGYADDWQVGYEGPNASVVTLTCIDAFAIFEANEREASISAGAGEDSGARIDRILDSVNWPDADRIIAVGDSTLQATTLEGSALAELQLTADSELGEFYMGSAGHATFRNRLALYEELRSLRPNAVFGDSVEQGDTTVNLITNPSAEIDLTGWAAGGSVPPTLTRDSTRAWSGTYSVLATWATATPVTLPLVQYTITGLTVGKTYTASVYVYVPSGSPGVALLTPTTGGQWGTASFGLFDQWVRLSLTFTAVSSTLLFQVWPENSTTTAGQQVWLDALQCEEGGSATDYTDGDQAMSEWDGTAHASTSRRTPELPYADIQVGYDAQSIRNRISITRVGGTVQTAEDTASQTAYLTRTYPRSDILLETDGAALDYAGALLHQARTPELRFTQMELRPRRDDRLWPQVLGREIGDRIGAVRRPPGGGDPISREVFVRGIEHEFTADLRWITRWTLQSGTRGQFLILNNPTLGQLDNNALGY